MSDATLEKIRSAAARFAISFSESTMASNPLARIIAFADSQESAPPTSLLPEGTACKQINHELPTEFGSVLTSAKWQELSLNRYSEAKRLVIEEMKLFRTSAHFPEIRKLLTENGIELVCDDTSLFARTMAGTLFCVRVGAVKGVLCTAVSMDEPKSQTIEVHRMPSDPGFARRGIQLTLCRFLGLVIRTEKGDVAH